MAWYRAVSTIIRVITLTLKNTPRAIFRSRRSRNYARRWRFYDSQIRVRNDQSQGLPVITYARNSSGHWELNIYRTLKNIPRKQNSFWPREPRSVHLA
jgi:hypothetical protein